ncbi:helix-turn-helix domain-containing protein [Dictyobacter aurantiacus]|nr:helix-turn-helix domain-containing protein [Dictyobacter aurantiacus]
MSNNADLPNITGFLTIKEAAQILALAERTVYEYVETGRLPAVRAADILLIPQEEVANFRRGNTGRPRKNTPPWRISSGKNVQHMVLIHVQIRSGKEDTFFQRLDLIRQENRHTFPGTVIRSIASNTAHPEQITIILIWRGTVMPHKEDINVALEALKKDLMDELDWDTAQYTENTVLMHT